jgi:hypothetical protein
MASREPAAAFDQKHAAQRRAAKSRAEQALDQKPHPLVHLQRQVRNAKISRLLAQREAPEDEELMAKHDDGAASHGVAEVGLEGGTLSDELSGRIQAKRGAGSALDGGTRAKMESSFGDRFEDVRVHTDDESDRLNRRISARAFTTGTDIFFSRDASPSDGNLLAHELAHVVQQRGTSAAGGPMRVGAAGDSHEHEADSAAGAVASGGTAATAQRDTEAPDLVER